MPETQQRCGTCRWLNVGPDKDGKLRVRSNRVYWCMFDVKWPEGWPSSVRPMNERELINMKRYINADQGTTCPCWEARPK